jgi:hypothetical protein
MDLGFKHSFFCCFYRRHGEDGAADGDSHSPRVRLRRAECANCDEARRIAVNIDESSAAYSFK